MQTDKGTEFTNKILQDFLAENDVHFFTTTNINIKCAVVERFNRTLKAKMFKYLTANSTKRYIDVLQSLTDAYNRSKHRTTEMRPIDVDPHDMQDENVVFGNTYGVSSMRDLLLQSSVRKDLFEIGDEVRIALVKKTFSKGYKQQWSKDTYKVVNCIHRIDKTVYELANSARRVLRKKFYPEEMSKVTINLSHIDHIVRSRTVDGKKQHLVKIGDSRGDRNRWIADEDVPPAVRKV